MNLLAISALTYNKPLLPTSIQHSTVENEIGAQREMKCEFQ